MATLKAEATFSFKEINRLIKVFPDLNGRLLSLIGKRSREILRNDFLSGQELNLKKGIKDRKGKNLITSDVNKKRTFVKIYSYPVNLFEKGRTLRSGRREVGKFIITKKLKQVVNSKTGNYISEFEKRILAPEIKKAGF